MRMFRTIFGITLTMLFLFTCAATVSAAKDNRKKNAKEQPGAKAAKVEPKVEIDPQNPMATKLRRLEKLKEDLAEADSASRKKRLSARIKKLQEDIKERHASAVDLLKRKIHARENRLKYEQHKAFRETIEKDIKKLQDEIKQWDKWAGVKPKDAKDGGKAPAGQKGGKAPAKADKLDLDIPMM